MAVDVRKIERKEILSTNGSNLSIRVTVESERVKEILIYQDSLYPVHLRLSALPALEGLRFMIKETLVEVEKHLE